MKPAHLKQVLVIEQACYTLPWSVNIFYQELVGNPNALYYTAMAGEQVVGYAGIWLILDEAHVTNIAVAPEWRRRGVAKRLMEHLLQNSLNQGVNRITLEVRRTNLAAQKLYESFGFVAAGVRKGYYSDNNEDGLIMWLYDIGAYFDRKEQANG